MRFHTTSSDILIFECDESLFFSTFLSPGFGLYIVILSDNYNKITYLRSCSRKKLFVGVANVIIGAPAHTVSNRTRTYSH